MTKPSLLRAVLFPLAIASVHAASLHAADAPDTPSVPAGFVDGSRQPSAGSFLERTVSRELWPEWMDGLAQFPFSLAPIVPPPQAAGQTLYIGPGGQNGGANYTVSAAGETWDTVYLGSSGAGTLTHSAGTLTITTQLCLGLSSAGNGTYNLSGTGVLTSPTEIIGYSVSAGATFNQNGGTNKTPSLILAAYQGTSGTYSFNGGLLQAGSVTANITGAGSASVFNFNGGTLQATGSTGSFLQGLTYTNVQTGGAFIDSNGYNVTVGQSLLHDTSAGAPATDGGLTKPSAGTLTFTGGNTYRGATNINAGTLAYGGAGGSSGGAASP